MLNLSSRLSDLGQREEALDAIEQAAGIYRQLADARPDIFLPDLGRTLNSLAKMLSLFNRDADASVIREEANAVFGLLAME